MSGNAIAQELPKANHSIVMSGRGFDHKTRNYERIVNGLNDKEDAFLLQQKITTAIKKSQRGICVRHDFSRVALEKNAIHIGVNGQIDASNITEYRVYIAANGHSQTKINEYTLAVSACEDEIRSLWRLQSHYFDLPQHRKETEMHGTDWLHRGIVRLKEMMRKSDQNLDGSK